MISKEIGKIGIIPFLIIVVLGIVTTMLLMRIDLVLGILFLPFSFGAYFFFRFLQRRFPGKEKETIDTPSIDASRIKGKNDRKYSRWSIVSIVSLACVLLVALSYLFLTPEKSFYTIINHSHDDTIATAAAHDFPNARPEPSYEFEIDTTKDEIKQISAGVTKEELRNLIKLRKLGSQECLDGKIIKKPRSYSIAIDGMDFFVKDKKIVNVAGLKISPQILEAMTEKLAIIDDVLYQCCLDLNREYSRRIPNEKTIMFIMERKYSFHEKIITILDNVKNGIANNLDDIQIKASIDTVKVKKS